MSSSIATAVIEFGPAFSGRLLQPSEHGYDTERQLHNAYVDKRPALIAQCRGAADIVEAIQFGQKHGLEIAVRGGGHNIGGRASCDGGLMVDLSWMRSVDVDPVARVARVQGGALWRDLNRETQLFGLATTGGVVSSTGVGGLTLGGGLGWLMPKYGMALDNLASVTVVLADGRVVKASQSEHPDLFWAVRGGGGNFGVAASLEFALHKVGPIVTGGLVAHPFAQAREVLRFYRDTAAHAPDDMMLVGAMQTAPDGVTKVAGIAAGHFGTAEAGAAAIAPIKKFGHPIVDVLGPMPYTQLNMMLDPSLPRGARNYWKAHFLPELSDAAIDVLVEGFAAAPSPMAAIVIEHFHGAVTRVPVSDTAYALRTPGFNVLVLSQWKDHADDARSMAWGKSTYGAVRAFGGPNRYMNYLDADDTGDANLKAAYGPNLGRLRELKKKYDPKNVFHLNVNIPPA
jgi:FAD/FMN-containing dehydrogenase